MNFHEIAQKALSEHPEIFCVLVDKLADEEFKNAVISGAEKSDSFDRPYDLDPNDYVEYLADYFEQLMIK